MSLDHRYTVTVTLMSAVVDLHEVLGLIGGRLALGRVTAAEDDRGRTVLGFTLESGDLWFTLLTVMNGVAASGYRPVSVAAYPQNEAFRSG